ncbi:MAG TPA: hypothetical protein DDZ80_14205 [Cyanobacteria bacterium UBA8803]|nr:hypothetical protein [Cyanobacteria bacterium UBA9273]HBL59591.1 hypothetical protein [Cyanobacteria bacterium UBA8803]
MKIFLPLFLSLSLFPLGELSLSSASPQAKNTKPQVLQSLQMHEILQILAVRASAALERSMAEEQALKVERSQPQPTTLPRRAEFLSQALPQAIQQGQKLSLNGRIFPVAWKQWQLGSAVRTAISDVGAEATLGVELLSSGELTRQPIQWFSSPPSTPMVLASQLSGAYRYLDITDLAKNFGWQLQVEGDTLYLNSVPARVANIRMEEQPWGFRIVLDLDRPTPWQVSDRRTEGEIVLSGLTDPSLIEQFNPPPAPTEQIQEEEDATPVPSAAPENKPVIRIENDQNQTTMRVSIPDGLRLQVFSLPNPNRLVLDLRPDALIEKEIFWAPGIRWRQQYINLGESRFPVVWLEVNPTAPGLSLRPIWSNPASQMGTAPLIQTAQLWQAFAAINAGFFNRKNQLPLGAIRRDGRWFSGPILNRGAIAWNDRGQFKIGRLSLSETLVTSGGARLPILLLNTGYVKAGISRYTPEWGAAYTPLTDNEVIVAIENNQVTGQVPGGLADQGSFAIPANGYLLTLRANDTAAIANLLSVGTQVQIESSTLPADFNSYPHLLGAGPLLLQNRQIVLDAKAEQFSDAFAQQLAVRSSIGTTATGTLIVAAIHNRVSGAGPSLTETAQLMQQLGAIDALNLDGGSSTGLYLGGNLLDRSPATAARVHNGLGFFRPLVP